MLMSSRKHTVVHYSSHFLSSDQRHPKSHHLHHNFHPNSRNSHPDSQDNHDHPNSDPNSDHDNDDQADTGLVRPYGLAALGEPQGAGEAVEVDFEMIILGDHYDHYDECVC